ncbi:MAG: hypothetical protein ABI670_08730, partial [Chloroflexota bacterium]
YRVPSTEYRVPSTEYRVVTCLLWVSVGRSVLIVGRLEGIAVMRDDKKADSVSVRASSAGGGAAVGAGFGALVGAVLGWFLGAPVGGVPTIGPVVGQGALTSTIVGLLAGVVVGALIGALVAVNASTDGEDADVVDEDTPVASADVWNYAPPVRGGRLRHENDGPFHASDAGTVASVSDAQESHMEAITMNDDQKGRNPNNFTGTEDAIDPETGAIGTAGTPMTTGYGVSGSTIGTGSQRRQSDQEDENFRGATPDTVPYDAGGRGTGDRGILRGAEREEGVVDKHSDADRNQEASIPRDAEHRDVYEQSAGYGQNLVRDPGTGMADVEVDRSLDSPPRNVPVEDNDANASAGTNVPGTRDPRGLGDNTDDM